MSVDMENWEASVIGPLVSQTGLRRVQCAEQNLVSDQVHGNPTVRILLRFRDRDVFPIFLKIWAT